MSGLFTLLSTTYIITRVPLSSVEDSSNEKLQEITSMFQPYTKQFKREKIVSNSMDDFKMLFMASA